MFSVCISASIAIECFSSTLFFVLRLSRFLEFSKFAMRFHSFRYLLLLSLLECTAIRSLHKHTFFYNGNGKNMRSRVYFFFLAQCKRISFGTYLFRDIQLKEWRIEEEKLATNPHSVYNKIYRNAKIAIQMTTTNSQATQHIHWKNAVSMVLCNGIWSNRLDVIDDSILSQASGMDGNTYWKSE